MKKNASNIHEFAIYYDSLDAIIEKKEKRFTIHDDELVHRFKNVLRTDIGDTSILFSQKIHAQVTLRVIGKKNLEFELVSWQSNLQHSPAITLFLPILKREALNDALYAAVELGVNVIQLVKTEKIQRSWSDHDGRHAQKIIIAAAEQSKNFAFPLLREPILLTEVVKDGAEGQMIFFDPDGNPLFDTLEQMRTKKSSHIGIIIGPEGDLTLQEKELLRTHDVTFCALTPTVLRSQQAAALALGSLRAGLR